MIHPKIKHFLDFKTLKEEIKGQVELFQAQSKAHKGAPLEDQDFPAQWWHLQTSSKNQEKPLLILGGMGTLAGYQALEIAASLHPQKNIWLCQATTIPDRTEAILAARDGDQMPKQLVCEKISWFLDESINLMGNPKAIDFVIACNTAHYFLEEIKDYLETNCNFNTISLPKASLETVENQGLQNTLCLMTTGSMDGRIYSKYYNDFKGSFTELPLEANEELMSAIASVKQFEETHSISHGVAFFNSLSNLGQYDSIIVGCTEIPEIMRLARLNDSLLDERLEGVQIISPIEEALKKVP